MVKIKKMRMHCKSFVQGGICEMDSKRKSFVKAISWRFLASSVTILIIFFITNEWATSVIAGSIETVVKLLIYYGHERAWNGFPWLCYEIGVRGLGHEGVPMAHP